MNLQSATLPAVRHCIENDAAALHALIGKLPPLTVHTSYTYWAMCRYARATSFVAEHDGTLVGLAMGWMPASIPSSLFVWQLGVAPAWRGKGLGDRLLDRMTRAARESGAECLEFTIGRDNDASRRVFGRLARRIGSSVLDLGVASVPGIDACTENTEFLHRIPLRIDP